jgi:hypothetical protein
MFTKYLYRGLPTALLLIVAGAVQLFAIAAFI